MVFVVIPFEGGDEVGVGEEEAADGFGLESGDVVVVNGLDEV